MKRIKIRSKARKWIIHYMRLGLNGMNFREAWPISNDSISSTQAFHINESTGSKHSTSCELGISALTAGKKIHGMTVDMWAQDRASGHLSKHELVEYCNEVPGMLEEVEALKFKYL